MHGDGEQSTKFGDPCPNWPHPLAFCRFEKDVPVVELLFEVPPLPELPPPPVLPPLPDPPPLLVVELSATVICVDFDCELALASETEIEKPNVPLVLGVPEIFPLPPLSETPAGSWPELTENLYGAVPPVAVTVALYAVPTVADGSEALICKEPEFELPPLLLASAE